MFIFWWNSNDFVNWCVYAWEEMFWSLKGFWFCHVWDCWVAFYYLVDALEEEGWFLDLEEGGFGVVTTSEIFTTSFSYIFSLFKVRKLYFLFAVKWSSSDDLIHKLCLTSMIHLITFILISLIKLLLLQNTNILAGLINPKIRQRLLPLIINSRHPCP